MASTYLTRTPSSTGNDKIATFSAWVKRGSSLGSQNNLFTSFPASERTQLFFTGSDTLQLQAYSGNSATMNVETNRKFRDTHGWYHIVVAMDSTQATASNRAKIYVNGVQETSFAQTSYVSQNTTLSFNTSSRPFYIGTYDTSQLFFDGCMSHVHWVDGTQYAASDFGSTDSTTGEWKIKTAPSLTYGTNGFFILKDGNSVTDQSGQSNNLTVGAGTLTKTEDNPSNVFATWNPLAHNNGNYALTNGNTSYSNGDNNWSHGGLISTIGIPTSGKFYWEHKKTYAGNHIIFGLISEDQVHRLYKDAGTDIYERINGVQLSNSSNSGIYLQEATDSGSIGSVANGGILQCAYDSDNQKLWYGINGTWHNSGDPANGTNETIGASEFTDGKIYFAFSQSHNSSGTVSSDTNFGNGYFGTTAISSEGSNASGHGKFEYDVPNGFTALSTKGLNA